MKKLIRKADIAARETGEPKIRRVRIRWNIRPLRSILRGADNRKRWESFGDDYIGLWTIKMVYAWYQKTSIHDIMKSMLLFSCSFCRPFSAAHRLPSLYPDLRVTRYHATYSVQSPLPRSVYSKLPPKD